MFSIRNSGLSKSFIELGFAGKPFLWAKGTLFYHGERKTLRNHEGILPQQLKHSG